MSLYDKYISSCSKLIGYLENARKFNRLSHAFLIHADSEQVRRDFAIILAQIAACPESKDGRPCTTCRICRQLEEGTYPEFYPLTPVGKMYVIKIGDRENPEPNTLRYFEERFQLTSLGGANCKIGVIYDADRMNDESQNALLKTLEEPPPETLLILTTGNPAALLPTTRSRCQLLSVLTNRCEFNFTGKEQLFAALGALFFEANADLVKVETEVSHLIQVASGLNNDASERVTGEWASRLSIAAQTGDSALVKRVEQQVADAASGAYMKERGQFLTAILTFCQQVFQLSLGVQVDQLPNPEIFNNIDLSKKITPERGVAALREAEELLYTLRFNVNEELALRTFAVNLATRQK